MSTTVNAFVAHLRNRGPAGVTRAELEELAPFHWHALLNETMRRGHLLKKVPGPDGGSWVLDDDQRQLGA